MYKLYTVSKDTAKTSYLFYCLCQTSRRTNNEAILLCYRTLKMISIRFSRQFFSIISIFINLCKNLNLNFDGILDYRYFRFVCSTHNIWGSQNDIKKHITNVAFSTSTIRGIYSRSFCFYFLPDKESVFPARIRYASSAVIRGARFTKRY